MRTRLWAATAAASMLAVVMPVSPALAELDLSDSSGIVQGSLSGANEANDDFGTALVFGDFDGDGSPDLVVGAPGETVSGKTDSGAINISYGSGSSAQFTQNGAVPGATESNDLFGAALAVGNFNNDAYDDLAIGLPGEAVGNKTAAGYVVVMYGSGSGLTTAGAKNFGQDGPIPGAGEAGDHFGASLVAGDFDNDNYDDLAVGAPGEDIGSLSDGGAVSVIGGSASGLDVTDSVTFSQWGPIKGAAEAGDEFGYALTAGDFDGNGFDDLAIGAPGEDAGSLSDSGVVHVLSGAPAGLNLATDQLFSQAGALAGANEAGDRFGAALAAGDFNGDSEDDLAVGVPGEDVGSINSAGAVITIMSNGGLSTAGSDLMVQGATLGETVEAGDHFGAALATGRMDNDSTDDLAIGAPGENNSAGVVHAVYGSGAGLTGAGNQIVRQGGQLPDSPEANDEFGAALAIANFDGNDADDLAVGAPGEDHSGAAKAGHVTMVYAGSETVVVPTDNFQVIDGKIYDPNGDLWRGVGFNSAAGYYLGQGNAGPIIEDKDIFLNEWNTNILRLNVYCTEACPGTLQDVLASQATSSEIIVLNNGDDGFLIFTTPAFGTVRQYVSAACRAQLESSGVSSRAGDWNTDVVVHSQLNPAINCSLNLDVDEVVQAYAGTETVILVEYHNDFYPLLPTVGQAFKAREYFADLAETYKDNPYVWFSPYNEPTNECNLARHGAGYVNADGNPLTQQGVATKSWLDMHTPVIDAIRATGNTNMIVPVAGQYGQDRCDADGPFNYNESGLLTYGEAMVAADPTGNIAFDLHFYSRWRSTSVADVNAYFNELAAKDLPIIIGETGGKCDNGPLAALHRDDLAATALLLENWDSWDNPPAGAIHWQAGGGFPVTNAANFDASRMGPNNDPFTKAAGIDNLTKTGVLFYDFAHTDADYFGPITPCP